MRCKITARPATRRLRDSQLRMGWSSRKGTAPWSTAHPAQSLEHINSACICVLLANSDGSSGNSRDVVLRDCQQKPGRHHTSYRCVILYRPRPLTASCTAVPRSIQLAVLIWPQTLIWQVTAAPIAVIHAAGTGTGLQLHTCPASIIWLHGRAKEATRGAASETAGPFCAHRDAGVWRSRLGCMDRRADAVCARHLSALGSGAMRRIHAAGMRC